MTRTSWLSAISCAAMLAGLAASGWGNTSSTIDTGTAECGLADRERRRRREGEHGSGRSVRAARADVVTGVGGMIRPPTPG